MTELRDFDRSLAIWFESESLAPTPPGVLESVFDVTSRVRPRPWWLAGWGSRWVGPNPVGSSGPVVIRQARFAMAGAAGLAAAVVGLYLYFGQLNSIVGPATTPSPSPSSATAPSATPIPVPTTELDAQRPPERGILDPGRYWLMGPSPNWPAPGWPTGVSVLVPAGWYQASWAHGGGIQTIDPSQASPEWSLGSQWIGGARLSGWSVDNLYADSGAEDENGCPVSSPVDPPVGPAVDDLASGLAAIPGVEVTLPADVVLDGFRGKAMELTTPGFPDCYAQGPPGWTPLWPVRTERSVPLWGSTPESWGEYFHDVSWEGWHHQLWILNVEGVRFVIDAAHASDATPELVAELQQMVDSIDIQSAIPPGPSPTPSPPPTQMPEFDAPLPRPTSFERSLIFNVVNESDRPAKLLVGEDTSPPERIVGIATPDEVPPHGEALVTFRVPASRTWAIFVNGSTLILASDVNRCVGRVPIEIRVEFDGLPFWGTRVDGSCASQE